MESDEPRVYILLLIEWSLVRIQPGEPIKSSTCRILAELPKTRVSAIALPGEGAEVRGGGPVIAGHLP
jgi:hypothetical protein